MSNFSYSLDPANSLGGGYYSIKKEIVTLGDINNFLNCQAL